MKKTVAVMLIAMAITVFGSGPAFAASPWTMEKTYIEKTAKKLEFGYYESSHKYSF